MTKVASDKLKLSALLMILAIVGIAAFEGYWVRKLYSEEWSDLKKETDVAFRDVVYKLQMEHLRKDTLFLKHDLPPNLFLFNLLDSMRGRWADSAQTDSPFGRGEKMSISIRTDFRGDSNKGKDTFFQNSTSVRGPFISVDSRSPHVLRYYSSVHAPESPLVGKQIDSAYKKELLKMHITVPYLIRCLQGKEDELERSVPADGLQTNFLYVGLSNAYAYQAIFGSPVSYLLGRMKWPVGMALLLLAFTSAALLFLYRNLRQQQRLAVLKNEFISNMTHELKTPISTINVAVEALRHFDALDDPERTKEYLDISALELQRLSLLVDKVLKLSQFENEEIEFSVSTFDLEELAAEVIAGMRLPLEKAGAMVRLNGVGRAGDEGGQAGDGFMVKGDRAHISSVISNLLDNALKYSKESPVITVELSKGEAGNWVVLAVADNGIGIPAAYIDRIFDKFFRVPSGDHHNIKGYGLGLNYVQHIVRWHKGDIEVESKEGKGSTFTIKFPAV